MSKRKTVGERIAQKFWGYSWNVETLSKHIDRAIRRAQAKAWSEGYISGSIDALREVSVKVDNPYRKAKQ